MNGLIKKAANLCTKICKRAVNGAVMGAAVLFGANQAIAEDKSAPSVSPAPAECVGRLDAISFYSQLEKVDPDTNLFVLDVSNSMFGGGIDPVVTKEFLDKINTKTLIAFSSSAEIFSKSDGLVNAGQVFDEYANQWFGGGTNYSAAVAAIKEIPDIEHFKTIIWLSDGYPSSPLSDEEVSYIKGLGKKIAFVQFIKRPLSLASANLFLIINRNS